MRKKTFAVVVSVLLLIAVAVAAIQLSNHTAAKAEESLASSFYLYELKEASSHFSAISVSAEDDTENRDHLLGMASFKSAIDMLQFRPAESRNYTYFSDVTHQRQRTAVSGTGTGSGRTGGGAGGSRHRQQDPESAQCL